jgi:acyl-CoA reductase-like NAD-dependent aldehyde dehydrogenase
MITTGHYVAGELLAGGPTRTPVHNPSTGEVIGYAAEAEPGLVDAAVSAASAASAAWGATTVAERMHYLLVWRDKLLAESDRLLDDTVDELGLTPAFASAIHVGRATNCLVGLDGLAETVLRPLTVGNSRVVREPAGVLAAITAWNFPLHQLVSKIAAGLIMGNTVVLKPSEVKPLAAWRATELLAELGLPPGVVNVVGGAGPTVGAELVAHRDVDVISFTGSRRVGAQILAASAGSITRSVLELGGKNAAVLLPDAPLETAVPGVLGSCLFNNGQVCGAQSRLIVPRERHDEVVDLVAEHVGRVVVGPARRAGTTLGPVVSAAQLDRVRGYVRTGLDTGLRRLAGGADPVPDVPSGGYYVAPTVFTDVPVDSALAQEEIFGPVLVIQPCADEEEMVRVANSTRYGLTGAVWSADLDAAVAVARRLRCGQVQVNGGAFNLHAPYGGFKESGNGREHGLAGLAEFTEVKSLQLPA